MGAGGDPAGGDFFRQNFYSGPRPPYLPAEDERCSQIQDPLKVKGRCSSRLAGFGAHIACAMALTQNIGEPWVHSLQCSECKVEPVTGNLYTSTTRYDYGYCSRCHITRQGEEVFLKVGLWRDSRPFQIHCIDCDKCGVSPIQGPRYRHKKKENFNLCAPCFFEATSARKRHAESPTAYTLVEHTEVRCSYKTHQPVFHFGISCSECQVSPICGPRYKSAVVPDYDLCLVCFDSMLTKKKIDAPAFRRIAVLEASQAVHVIIHSCNNCGVTPICGPAYISQKKGNKILCLLCYLNKTREKQATYTRQEPPLVWSAELGPGQNSAQEGDAKEVAAGGYAARGYAARGYAAGGYAARGYGVEGSNSSAGVMSPQELMLKQMLEKQQLSLIRNQADVIAGIALDGMAAKLDLV